MKPKVGRLIFLRYGYDNIISFIIEITGIEWNKVYPNGFAIKGLIKYKRLVDEDSYPNNERTEGWFSIFTEYSVYYGNRNVKEIVMMEKL